MINPLILAEYTCFDLMRFTSVSVAKFFSVNIAKIPHRCQILPSLLRSHLLISFLRKFSRTSPLAY